MLRSFLQLASAAWLLVGLVSGQSSLATVNTVCSAVPGCSASPASVPPAWYNLTFSVNPTSITGATSPTFGWEASEPGDAACGFQHHGIATFNGTFPQYIDLNRAVGANSSGTAIPGLIGGPTAGSVAVGNAGWSFEVTFRPHPNQLNAKTWAIGAGAPLYNIFLGNDGNTNAGLNCGMYDGNTVSAVDYADGHSASIELVNPYIQYSWYHVVFVAQQVTTVNQTVSNGVTHGAWWLYVNGVMLNFTSSQPNLGTFQVNIYPPAVVRQLAYLAKSDWNDAPWTGLIDTFRIYNYALTGPQVATLYSGEMGGCPVPISTAAPTGSVAPNLLPRTTSTAVTPFFSLPFTTNPLSSTVGASGYGWVNTLSTDTAANQAIHQGLLQLNGSLSQYVNLNLSSGTNSVGVVIPIIGGGTSGWTFEIMMNPANGADAWSKVLDIGTTRTNGIGSNCLNDILLGWDGNAGAPDSFWQFDVCDNSTGGIQYQTGDAIGEISANQWIHVVLVFAAPGSTGLTNYFTYLNGVLYTTVTNVFYPIAIARQNAWIGRSGWSDPYWTGYIDFFNIYNQALSDVQVTNIYAAAIQPSQTTSSSTGRAASVSSATSAASTAAVTTATTPTVTPTSTVVTSILSIPTSKPATSSSISAPSATPAASSAPSTVTPTSVVSPSSSLAPPSTSASSTGSSASPPIPKIASGAALQACSSLLLVGLLVVAVALLL